MESIPKKLMSSSISFFIWLGLFLALTVHTASSGSWVTLFPALMVLMGVSIYISKRFRRNEPLGAFIEYTLFYLLSFATLFWLWKAGLIIYRDPTSGAISKMFFLSFFAAVWLMVAVRPEAWNWRFPGSFRPAFSKTLPAVDDEAPKSIMEAFALGKPTAIKRAIRNNPNLLEERGGWGETPLHWMAQANDVRGADILIKCGMAVDMRDASNGETALHYAATDGHHKIATLLLKAGADPNAPNQDGDTPLHWACHGGHIETVRRLLRRGADPRIKNHEGRDCFKTAGEMGHNEIVALLTNHLKRFGPTSTFEAED